MAGWSELIFGSMYCGKSEELIRRLKRVSIAGKKFQLFKPVIDNRYSVNRVVTHDNNELREKLQEFLESYVVGNIDEVTETVMGEISGSMHAISVNDSKELLEKVDPESEVIGIDEVQFFDKDLPEIVQRLVKSGKRVIMSGLDMYATGEPFGIVPILACQAKYVEKLHAVCSDCGIDAYISHELNSCDSTSKVRLGSKGKYIALCQTCDLKRKNL